MRRGEPFIFGFQLRPNPAELSDVGSLQIFFGITTEFGISQDTDALERVRDRYNTSSARGPDGGISALAGTVPPVSITRETPVRERRRTKSETVEKAVPNT